MPVIAELRQVKLKRAVEFLEKRGNRSKRPLKIHTHHLSILLIRATKE
jgi:hypothetical protein